MHMPSEYHSVTAIDKQHYFQSLWTSCMTAARTHVASDGYTTVLDTIIEELPVI